MGRTRHRWAIVRCVVAWWPLLVLAGYVVAWRWFIGWPWRVAVAGAAVWCEVRGRIFTDAIRAAWWRCRWWADARSAGLVVVADPGLNATAEKGGRMAVGLELAPALRRVRCTGRNRLLNVKVLPGQSFEDVERAVPMLAERWGANVAVIPHPRRRLHVLIEVVPTGALDAPLPAPSHLLGGRRR